MKYKFYLLVVASVLSALITTSCYAEDAFADDMYDEDMYSDDIYTNPFTEVNGDEKNSAVPVNSNPALNVREGETVTENDLALIKQRNINFESGDYFWMRRYNFKTNSDVDYYSTIAVPGNEIELRYIDPETRQWVITSDYSNIPKTQLFIETDMTHLMISVPSVYKNDFTGNTLTVIPENERPITIAKGEGNFVLTFRFPQDPSNIGEIWALQSSNQLVDWTNSGFYELFKTHDLSFERRFAWDGYYFKTPSNYVPAGENVLYRHPSNYSGATWARYGGSTALEELGYITTKICMLNQNEEGYWATGPKSLWLEEDFNIRENFYDTRFNTDFATSLIYAYKRYNTQAFLDSAIKYAAFFEKYAEANHYDTNNGGWLVEDYTSNDADRKRTHTSLNHQLAEIIFLYELYNVTNDQKYTQLADKMLLAIEDTKDNWVLPSGDLNYAIMYTGTANTMVDYPYLTYNDLFTTKKILSQYFNKTNSTIEYLMESKKRWMDQNNITGYLVR